MLLLEMFNYMVDYKLRRVHLHVDHFSRLLEQVGGAPIDDRVVDKNLFVVMVQLEWY